MTLKPLLLAVFVSLAAPELIAQTPPVYKGHIRLPTELYTPDGIRLEKGQLDVQVGSENGVRTLAFSQNGKVQARIIASSGSQGSEAATVPLVGTVYLRSAEEPIGTNEERQYSKTGLPQYQDQSLDWKTTLRVYRLEHPDSKDVYVIFQERQKAWNFSRTYFKLFLAGSARKAEAAR